MKSLLNASRSSVMVISIESQKGVGANYNPEKKCQKQTMKRDVRSKVLQVISSTSSNS